MSALPSRLHTGDTRIAHGGAVPGVGGQIEPVARRHRYVAFGRVEDDRPLHTEEHLVIVVLVLAIDIARCVRPRVGFEAFIGKGGFGLGPGGAQR